MEDNLATGEYELIYCSKTKQKSADEREGGFRSEEIENGRADLWMRLIIPSATFIPLLAEVSSSVVWIVQGAEYSGTYFRE